jgi:hypothetical protein
MEPCENGRRIKMTETAKLLSCPFCGSEKVKMWNENLGTGKLRIPIFSHWIQCQENSCYAMQQGSSREKVIERWNRRTPPRNLGREFESAVQWSIP